jgi:hypothetical protein
MVPLGEPLHLLITKPILISAEDIPFLPPTMEKEHLIALSSLREITNTDSMLKTEMEIETMLNLM